MKTVVYFHGLNSSSRTDKVDTLRQYFKDKGQKVDVIAFDANINPEIAAEEVSYEIDIYLAEHHMDEDDVIFIGTSLGAWLANELSDMYGCPAILINPCYQPQVSLLKLGVDEKTANQYYDMSLAEKERKTFVIDRIDEVLDHIPLLSKLDFKTDDIHLIDGYGHRCNGDNFIKVLEEIRL